MFLFWDNMPIALEYTHRMLFGGLLIVYGVFRFIRLWNQD
ncbi:hypothetical protein MPR_0684 [Myroides profundi]|nr:hypothetical protein MPR_0684 [Myroides profundi]